MLNHDLRNGDLTACEGEHRLVDATCQSARQENLAFSGGQIDIGPAVRRALEWSSGGVNKEAAGSLC